MLKKNYKFILFSTFLFVVIFVVEHINNRFFLNDFKVYYLAGKAFLNNQQVYGVSFGLDTGFYKYSPFILLSFLPSNLFSFEFAAIIHFIILAICTVLSLFILKQISNYTLFAHNFKQNSILLYIALICILNHLFRELHLGNVNILIILLLCAGLLFTIKNKHLIAGISIAIAILIKPYLIILCLPLLIHKKNKTLFSIVITIISSVLITFIVFGITNSLSLHKDWFYAMTNHNSYIHSNHTISSLVHYYFFINLPSSSNLYFLILLILVYIFIVIQKSKSQKNIDTTLNNSYLTLSYFIILASIPSILITDTEHFLFSLPLIFLILVNLQATRKTILIFIFIILIVLYGSNSPDIYGNYISEKIEDMGLLGISNIGIILLSILILFKQINSKPSSVLKDIS